MLSQLKFATVEQDTSSKVPFLQPGEITADIMREYETACLGYFNNKEIAKNKQVRKILAGLHDSRIQDWIAVDHEHFLGLTFAEFMKEFRTAYLPEDWEEIARIELLGTVQKDDTFWDFAVNIQTKNSLLCNTQSYLDKEQLHHHLEASMTPKLSLCCRLEKSSKVVKFEDWVIEVKHVDDLLRSERADFEVLAKSTREVSRRSNALNKPFCHVNTNHQNPGSSYARLVHTPRISLPKLLDSKRQLIYDNNSCLKCRHVFVYHCSPACMNNFPNPTMYKTLTQAYVDTMAKCYKKNMAAILPQEDEPAMQLIAVVMGSSSNPVAYMPPNLSNVIEEGKDSDASSGVSTTAAMMSIPSTSAPLKAVAEDLALQTVPHLYWHCSIAGPANSFPVTFNALIDHGSHTVLICDSFAQSLGLKRHKLHTPMAVEMAIPGDGAKRVIKLIEWVKLCMYNLSSSWTSKSVRTVITPSLCANVILGLPFLAHNSIVIDHES